MNVYYYYFQHNVRNWRFITATVATENLYEAGAAIYIVGKLYSKDSFQC